MTEGSQVSQVNQGSSLTPGKVKQTEKSHLFQKCFSIYLYKLLIDSTIQIKQYLTFLLSEMESFLYYIT